MLHENPNLIPETSSLIFGESVFSSFKERAATLESLFETFSFEKVQACIEESALLFSHQNSSSISPNYTGLVVNIKDTHISVVPIVDGFVLPQGIYCHPFGHLHLVSFIHGKLVHLNPEFHFPCNMKLLNPNLQSSPFPFLNFGSVNKKLFKLSHKLLRKFCNLMPQKNPNIERSILSSDAKTIEVEKKSLKIDSSTLHVYEAFFSPELFDLPQECNLIKGILDSLANIHSDLKRMVLKVFFLIN